MEEDFEYVEDAYKKLSKGEQIEIDFICNQIIEGLQARCPVGVKMMFSYKSARQLIAALGIWMVTNHKFQVSIGV